MIAHIRGGSSRCNHLGFVRDPSCPDERTQSAKNLAEAMANTGRMGLAMQLLIALLLVLVTEMPVKAADFSVESFGVGKPYFVSVVGKIKPEDGKRFASLVAPLPQAIIGLASPGGNLLASIQIGEIIRNKKFTTIVPDKLVCASGCALIWLAGARRYVWDTAKIGFHGAFDTNMKVSGPGNALIGAYLNKLGLTYDAVFYMTAASPTDMKWLHSDDARRLGIAAGELNELNLDTPLLVERSAGSGLRSDAIKFVIDFYNQWTTSDTARLMAAIATQYSDNVDYYGAVKNVGEVAADKKRWMQKWPIQKYKVRLESMTVNCLEKILQCMATGVVDWVAENPERSSTVTGSSRFSLDLGKVSPERFVIMRESTFVLTKQSLAH